MTANQSKQNMKLKEIDGIWQRSNEGIETGSLRDAHCHLVWLGMKHSELDLLGASSPKECIDRALDFNISNDWIIGRGWNEENWDVDARLNLTRQYLDKNFPDNPVYLVRIDGHAAWCNSKALELANIKRKTTNPVGGEILKDVNGDPSGILIDMALEIVNEILPKKTDEEIEQYILKAVSICKNYGLSEVHDMDVHLEWLPIFEKLAKENRLDINIKTYIRAFDDKYLAQKIKPKRINNWHLAGLKFYADGALGSRGAALLDDYSDKANHKGLFLISHDELLEKSIIGLNRGFEIATHAIGDGANRMTLDVYEMLRKKGFTQNLRIEHAQIVHPNDLNRFAENDIQVSIQPAFALSDRNMAVKRLGERISYSYRWKSLLDTGARILGSSDFPIESPDPLTGINALINSDIPWQKAEELETHEAIEIYKVR
jgi:predicted amidohydrolase YtcJ